MKKKEHNEKEVIRSEPDFQWLDNKLSEAGQEPGWYDVYKDHLVSALRYAKQKGDYQFLKRINEVTYAWMKLLEHEPNE